MKLLHHIMIKTHHVRTTLQDIMKQLQHVMNKPHNIMKKLQHVMNKPHQIMINNHTRKLWLSIKIKCYLHMLNNRHGHEYIINCTYYNKSEIV